MIYFPPIPNWNALHPLIVHFPIALLLVAPLFVLLGMVSPRRAAQAFLMSALILMVVGTASVFLAMETGEAARRLVSESPQVRQTLEQHEQLAQTTAAVFSVLTIAFAALLAAPAILRRELNRALSSSLLAAFLILYTSGALFLVNTAHQGGRLVHELGVQAQTAPAAPAGATAGALSSALGASKK